MVSTAATATHQPPGPRRRWLDRGESEDDRRRQLADHADDRCGARGRRGRPRDPRSAGVGAQPSKAASVLGSISVGAETPEGAGEPGLDGATGQTQHRCRLRLRQGEQVPARDDIALTDRQRRDRDEELTASLLGEDGGLGRGGRLTRGTIFDQGELVARAPARRATAVLRLVGHDGEDPGPKGRALTMTCQRSVRLHERILHHVLRVSGGPADHVCDPDGDWLVGADQRRVGIDVTLLRSASELAIVGWTALHRPILAQVGPTRTRRANVAARPDQGARRRAPHRPRRSTARPTDHGRVRLWTPPRWRRVEQPPRASRGSGRSKVSHLGCRADGVLNQPPVVRSLPISGWSGAV